MSNPIHVESMAIELSQEYIPPRFPCEVCGKETKEHLPKGTRICCMDNCRHLQPDPETP